MLPLRAILSYSVIVTYLTNFSNVSAAIRCYRCAMTPPLQFRNETIKPCQNFDYSEKFIVDCPYSTFCMKKDFTVNLSKPINGTVRDCAPQKYEYQVYEDDRWQMKVSVEEPYVEGCTETDDKGQRISQPRFCYCNSNLCNHSYMTYPSLAVIFFAYTMRLLV